MRCKVCGQEFDDSRSYCPVCGARAEKHNLGAEDTTEISWNTIDFPKPKTIEDIDMSWPTFNKEGHAINPSELSDDMIARAIEQKKQVSVMTGDASEGFVTIPEKTEEPKKPAREGFERQGYYEQKQGSPDVGYELPPRRPEQPKASSPFDQSWTMPAQKQVSEQPLWFTQNFTATGTMRTGPAIPIPQNEVQAQQFAKMQQNAYPSDATMIYFKPQSYNPEPYPSYDNTMVFGRPQPAAPKANSPFGRSYDDADLADKEFESIFGESSMSDLFDDSWQRPLDPSPAERTAEKTDVAQQADKPAAEQKQEIPEVKPQEEKAAEPQQASESSVDTAEKLQEAKVAEAIEEPVTAAKPIELFAEKSEEMAEEPKTAEVSAEEKPEEAVSETKPEATPAPKQESSFNTFYAKNDEFQKLLDAEFERLKELREKSGSTEKKHFSMSGIPGAVETPSSEAFDRMILSGTKDSDSMPQPAYPEHVRPAAPKAKPATPAPADADFIDFEEEAPKSKELFDIKKIEETIRDIEAEDIRAEAERRERHKRLEAMAAARAAYFASLDEEQGRDPIPDASPIFFDDDEPEEQAPENNSLPEFKIDWFNDTIEEIKPKEQAPEKTSEQSFAAEPKINFEPSFAAEPKTSFEQSFTAEPKTSFVPSFTAEPKINFEQSFTAAPSEKEERPVIQASPVSDATQIFFEDLFKEEPVKAEASEVKEQPKAGDEKELSQDSEAEEEKQFTADEDRTTAFDREKFVALLEKKQAEQIARNNLILEKQAEAERQAEAEIKQENPQEGVTQEEIEDAGQEEFEENSEIAAGPQLSDFDALLKPADTSEPETPVIDFTVEPQDDHDSIEDFLESLPMETTEEFEAFGQPEEKKPDAGEQLGHPVLRYIGMFILVLALVQIFILGMEKVAPTAALTENLVAFKDALEDAMAALFARFRGN